MNGSDSVNVNTTGHYGTQGVASVNNYPPGLFQPAHWTDKQGNFWIFGGVRAVWALYPGGANWALPEVSDLWKFDPLANTWTWVKGPGAPLVPGVYGTLGV